MKALYCSILIMWRGGGQYMAEMVKFSSQTSLPECDPFHIWEVRDVFNVFSYDYG
jgi:hypothetical protein